MKNHRALLLTICSASALSAQSPRLASAPAPKLREYSVDFGHCIVEFSIGFAFSRIKGRFTDAKGTIIYDEAQPSNSSVTMVIESKSIDTGWPHRDEHLKTSDFFDVEKYPTIVFQSDRLVPNGDAYTVEGRLTMHGVTKQISFPIHFVQRPIRSPESKWMVMNTAGALRLARKDFGITGGSTYNSWFDKARAATMSDSVDVSMEIEGYFPDATSQRSPRIDVALDSIRAKGSQYLIDRFANAKQTRPAAELPGWLQGGDMVVRGLIATNQIPEAVKFSRALTELFPTDTRSFALHGLALSISGNAKGAEQQYSKLEEVFRPTVVDPKEKFPQVDENWYWLDLLARTTLEWGYASKGVGLARTLVEIYPGSARAHTTYALLLAATGDAKAAAVEYAKALQLDPRETRALEWQRRLTSRAT